VKIGVLSDTHLNEPHPEFKKMIESHFREVDYILHAGDFVGWNMVEYLSGHKELIAVCGNMDPPEIRKAFPGKRVIKLGEFQIGLTHGGGPPSGLESRVEMEFENVHAIVYGHSHTPANHWVKDRLLFNPGSPTRSFINKPTLGILHLGEKIEGEILFPYLVEGKSSY
jgi:putative phosphoesterase